MNENAIVSAALRLKKRRRAGLAVPVEAAFMRPP